MADQFEYINSDQVYTYLNADGSVAFTNPFTYAPYMYGPYNTFGGWGPSNEMTSGEAARYVSPHKLFMTQITNKLFTFMVEIELKLEMKRGKHQKL